MAKPVKTEVDIQNPTLDNEARVLKQAKAEFDQCTDHWLKFRDTAEDCLRFVHGEHLDKNYINLRHAAGLPCLVENRIPAFVHSLTSEMRQHIPAIQVDSADDQTDPQFAEQTADLIRSIEQESKAKNAYISAAWYGIATGIGYVRVLNEYEGSDSFEQKLVIKPVEDPFTIYLDASHKAIDGSDSEYAFVVVDMSHDAYIRKFGKGKMVNLIESARIHGWNRSDVKSGNKWLTKNTVRVAEYYVKEYFEKNIWQVFNRETGAIESIETNPSGDSRYEILDSRKSTYPVIKHYVINDREILDENTWPGQYIPIVAFKGTEFWNQSERHLRGMVQDMRDPQKRIDYFLNWQATMVMLASTGQYIGTAKNFAENQHEWENINVSNQPYITYVPDSINGGAPPVRDLAEPPIQSAQTLVADAVEGLKAVTGMQAPVTGEGNEAPESGRAVLARIEQSHTASYHYQDNIRLSIAQVGRVLVESIPAFYSESGRQVMATKQNDEQYVATFNDTTEKMLDSAKFKVAIESGAAYATKRQEAMDAGMQLMGSYPQSAPLIADLVVENADWPGHKQIAARLRAAVPPNVLAATEDMDKMEGPQQVANLKSQVQSLNGQLQKMQQEITPDKNKIQKLEMENAFAKNDTQWELEKTKLEHQYQMQKLQDDREKVILEAEIKRKELELQAREIAIKEKELAMKATVAAAGIASDAMGHHHKVNESMNIEIPTNPDSMSGAEGDDNDLSLGTGENL